MWNTIKVWFIDFLGEVKTDVVEEVTEAVEDIIEDVTEEVQERVEEAKYYVATLAAEKLKSEDGGV